MLQKTRRVYITKTNLWVLCGEIALCAENIRKEQTCSVNVVQSVFMLKHLPHIVGTDLYIIKRK